MKSFCGATLYVNTTTLGVMGTRGDERRKCKGDMEESKSKLPFALTGSSGIMAVRMTGETG